MSPPDARPAGAAILLLFVPFVLFCHWRIYAGAWGALDIGLWDESVYLAYGVELNLRNAGAFGADALLYRAWYRLLGLFYADRIDVYMANWVAMPLAVAALMGLWLRRATPTRSLVVLCAPVFLFLISVRTFELWPRVTLFLAAVALATLILVRRARMPAGAFVVVAAGAFAASYVRGEMLLATVVALAVAAALAWRLPPRQRTQVALGVASVVAGAVALMALFAHPALDNGLRQDIAMAQHLSIAWVRLTGSTLDGFRDYETIIPQIFGDERRWWRWPLVAPGFVAAHVADNALRLPAAAAAFLVHPPLVVPGGRAAQIAEAAAVGLALLALFGRLAWRDGRGFVRRHAVALGAMAVLALPQLAAALVLYPHGHYLLLPFVLALLVVGLALADLRVGEGWPAARTVFLAVVAVLLTPRAFPGFYEARHARPDGAAARPTIETIRFVRDLRFARPVRLLTHDYGYAAYLPGVAVMETTLQQKGDRLFALYLTGIRADVIVVDGSVGRQARYRDDTSWKNFIANPEAAGWRRLAVPGAGRELLIRATLRCRHPACAQ
ncbi:MAG: hypothetical protein AB7F67_22735 [Rhodospirillaceae bacterium]